MYKVLILFFLSIKIFGQFNAKLELNNDKFLLHDNVVLTITLENITNKEIIFDKYSKDEIEIVIIHPTQGKLITRKSPFITRQAKFPAGLKKKNETFS